MEDDINFIVVEYNVIYHTYAIMGNNEYLKLGDEILKFDTKEMAEQVVAELKSKDFWI